MTIYDTLVLWQRKQFFKTANIGDLNHHFLQLDADQKSRNVKSINREMLRLKKVITSWESKRKIIGKRYSQSQQSHRSGVTGIKPRLFCLLSLKKQLLRKLDQLRTWASLKALVWQRKRLISLTIPFQQLAPAFKSYKIGYQLLMRGERYLKGAL